MDIGIKATGAVGAVGSARRQRGGTLLGVVIGFALGVTIAGLIAFALTKSSNPFDGKSGRITDPSAPNVGGDAAKSGEPRFDFSKILPGVESRRSQDAADRTPVAAPATGAAGAGKAGTAAGAAGAAGPATAAASAAPDRGKFYLQAGAYQNAADAEDQRAKLALMGIEATLQSVNIPDKGTLNRVRLGPYESADEMNQIKADLMKRGIATAVIKAP
jgi:cell division septation protein DedD